jgi:hypothetical protein
VVETDAYGRGAVPSHQLVRDAQAQADGGGGVRDREHDGVADRLDLGTAARRQLGADGAAEVRDKGGGIVVTVRIGQGCEAGDVCEHERRFDGRRLGHATQCVNVLTGLGGWLDSAADDRGHSGRTDGRA